MSGPDVAFSYAPGKVILGGEHAVVYGYPAIALALDRGIRIAVSRIKDSSQPGPVLRAQGLGFSGQVRPDPDGEGPNLLRLALNRLVELFGPEVGNLEFMADSAIPGGYGLGSSASLSVALVRGVLRVLDRPILAEQVADWALVLEQVFHGNPSGIDHTVISLGGMIHFQKTKDLREVRLLKCPQPLSLVIGLTGPHSGTSCAVTALKERSRRQPDSYKHVFEGIGEVVSEMSKAIEEGRLAALGELMNVNQGYLNALGVSTPELEQVCSLARANGALGAKLTGAGGGGAVVALVDDNPAELVSVFQKAGYLAFASAV